MIVGSLVLLFVMALSACTKDDDTNISKPTAVVSAPTDGSTYHSGDQLPIEVVFEDADELHEYSVEVLDKNLNTTIFSMSGHSHNKIMTIDTMVTLNVAMHSDFEMTVEVSNHNGEEAKETVEFHVHP